MSGTQSFAPIEIADKDRKRSCERVIVLLERLSQDLERVAARKLVLCFYVSMRCPRCGGIRLAVAELPQSDMLPCPHCERPCSYFLLAAGLTSRLLPFFESLRTIRQDQLIRMPWCGSLWHGLKKVPIAPEPSRSERTQPDFEAASRRS